MHKNSSFWTGGREALRTGLQVEKDRLDRELASAVDDECRREIEEQLRALESQARAAGYDTLF